MELFYFFEKCYRKKFQLDLRSKFLDMSGTYKYKSLKRVSSLGKKPRKKLLKNIKSIPGKRPRQNYL